MFCQTAPFPAYVRIVEIAEVEVEAGVGVFRLVKKAPSKNKIIIKFEIIKKSLLERTIIKNVYCLERQDLTRKFPNIKIVIIDRERSKWKPK